MSRYRKTIYYNTGRVNRVLSWSTTRAKMINGKRWREIDKIEAIEVLSLFNDITPFSKFLLGIINFYSIWNTGEIINEY